MVHRSTEQEITKLVKSNAKQSGMKLVGLEHRIKDKSSYLRKIATEYKPGYHYEVKDIVRYTMVAEPEELVDKTLNSLKALDNNKNNIY